MILILGEAGVSEHDAERMWRQHGRATARLSPERLRELAERLAAGAYDDNDVRRAIVRRILEAHDLPA